MELDMFISFGKHQRKSPQLLLLKYPDYALWMLREERATGNFANVQTELRRLIRLFDEIPIVVPCVGDDCENIATRGTVYRGAVFSRWWCDSCDAYSAGASTGKLYVVRSFGDAVGYVSMVCEARKQALRVLIKELAKAKGLPTRVGEQQAQDFFV
jgi:hypothetical protein